MTKEEKKSTEKFFEEAFTGFERGIIDEYAKQKAIEFKDWKEDKYWSDSYDENDMQFENTPRWSSNSVNPEYLTTEQLFDLFNTNKEV